VFGMTDGKGRRRPSHALMRYGLRSLVALAAGLSLAAHAQEISLQASTTVNWEYSDRLFVVRADPYGEGRANDEEANALRPVADAFWLLQPGLAAALNGEHGSLALRYNVGRTFYQRYAELDGWRHRFGAGLEVGLGTPVTLTLGYDWLRSEQPTRFVLDEALSAVETVQDPEADDPDIRERYTDWTTSAGIRFSPDEATTVSGQTTRRVRKGSGELDGYTRDRGDAAIDWQGNHGWNIRVGAGYAQGDFERGADVRERELQAATGRDFAEDWNWRVRYRQQQWERRDDEDTPGTGYRLHAPELSIAYRKPRGGGVALTGGIARRVPDDNDRESSTRLTGNLEIQRVFDRGGIAFEMRAGHADGTYSRDRYDTAWYREVGGRSNYAITRFFQIGAFLTYRVDDYSFDRAADDADTLRRPASSDSTRMGFSLRYTPRDWLSTECLFVRTDRYSLTLDDRYVENRVVLAVTLRASHRVGSVR